MQLDPRRGPLCVIQTTITSPAGDTTQAAYSMPVAPFGTLAWQLPVLVAYLSDPQTVRSGPSISSLGAHLHKRSTAPIPSPSRRYPFTPWHDSRVACLLDVVISPADATGWPQASLVLMEQESAPGSCAWMRVTREQHAFAILGRALLEMRAEQERLADQARTAPTSSLAELGALSGKVTAWLENLYMAARSRRGLEQAAAVRAQIRRSEAR